MWLDNQPPFIKPPLCVIYVDSLPPAVESTLTPPDTIINRSDARKDIDTTLRKVDNINS